MTRATIQTAIAAVITGAGAKNVHADSLGVIRATDPADYLTNYVYAAGDTVHTWFIGRTATAQNVAETQQGNIAIGSQLNRGHEFRIFFFYGWKNATSEALFQGLVDTVMAAFDNERTLGGWLATPISLQETDIQTFGGVLCHRAQFTIRVVEMIQGLTPH